MRKFTLELNVVKIIDYIEKCFKQKLHRIKFATKNSGEAYFYLLLEWSQKAPKIFSHFGALLYFENSNLWNPTNSNPEVDRNMRPLNFL